MTFVLNFVLLNPHGVKIVTKKALAFLAFVAICLNAGTQTALAGAKLMKASWYGKAFQGKEMANGDRFDMHDPRIVAHKTFPFGIVLALTNPENGKVLIVIVQDRGPFVKGRSLDLSYAAAKRLGYIDDGVASLEVKVIGSVNINPE